MSISKHSFQSVTQITTAVKFGAKDNESSVLNQGHGSIWKVMTFGMQQEAFIKNCVNAVITHHLP